MEGNRPTRDNASEAEIISASTLERMDTDAATLAQMLKSSQGYSITLTLKQPGANFTHHQITNNFPDAELLRCHGKCKDLLIEQLEAEKKR